MIVTVSELIDRAKAAADMRDNFVTPTQWMYWATQERLALDLFIARSGWPQIFSTRDIEVTGNEVQYTLDTSGVGVMAVVAVHQKDGERFRLLRHQNSADFNQNTERTGSAREYRLGWGGNDLYFYFYPNPKAGEVYRVTFIGHGQALTSPSHQVVYPMGWEERIVLGMARRALIKEESDTRAIDSEIALWDQRIEEACWSRVLSEAPSVRNVDSREYGWRDRLSIPPYGMWNWV